MSVAARDQSAYERFDDWTETPMLVLALVLIPVIAIPAFADVSEPTKTFFNLAGWVIWALFAIELIVLFWLAPDRRQMIRSHRFEIFLVVVPFLRPLRVLRVVRILPGLGVALVTLHRVLARRGLGWMLFAVGGVILLGGGLAAELERGEAGATIDSFGDGVWWALVTCTTVGYGDVAPLSAGGRVLATVLMLVGVSLLGVLTANIAAVFIDQDSDTDSELDLLRTELAEVNAKLDRILETTGSPA